MAAAKKTQAATKKPRAAAKTTAAPPKKKTAASAVLAHLKKKHGANKATTLDKGFSEQVEPLATGQEVIDYYLCGIGGLPVGRIVELYSEEGAGKSSAALAMLGAAQRAGATTVLIETENGFTKERARVLGVDPEELILVQPLHLEEALSMIEGVFDSLDPELGPALVVFDSLAATPTKAEVEEGVSDKMRVGGSSKIMSQAMRIITQKVEKSRATLLIVNQTRDKIGVMFGDNKTTPGGNALKFHASLRLCILGGKAVKVGEQHVGKDVTMMVRKTRLTEPHRKARLRFMYATGWDNDWSVVNLAKDMGLMPPRSRDVDEAREMLKLAEWDYHKAGDVVAKLKDSEERLEE